MPDTPNVVVCLCDQLRAFETGCYGNDAIRTPHLDRLAAEGVRLELAVSSDPVCTPARSCLLTGQYARTCTGMVGNVNDPWPSNRRVRLPAPILPERLKEHGYDTGLIGKWHIDPHPRLCGFDEALFPNIIHRHYGQQYVAGDGQPFTVDEFAPDFETRRLDAWLAAHRHRPFFLFHNISQPHPPLGPESMPPKYRNMYDPESLPLRANVFVDGKMADNREWFVILTDPDYWYRKWILKEPPRPTDTVPDDFDLRTLTAYYYGLTTCMDDQLGALMSSLERHGLVDDTIVVFTSDHGDNLGSHHRFNKDSLNDEAIRVPLIFWAPGRLSPRVNARQVAQTVDVVPTLYDLLGIDAPAHVQGRDLTPLLRGEREELEENWAFTECATGQIGIRTPTHNLGMQTDLATGAITDERVCFHDLTADPYQQHNMAHTDEQSDIASTLRQRLRSWHEETPRLKVEAP